MTMAKHDYELEADNYTHLHIDHRHMGAGGDDSWSPSVHEVGRRATSKVVLFP